MALTATLVYCRKNYTKHGNRFCFIGETISSVWRKNGIAKGEKTDWKIEKIKFLKRWNFIR